MFLQLFTELRGAKVPVSLREYLMLMEAMDRQVIGLSVDDFYHLSRSALVKDEKNLDKFDRVFGHVFKGFEKVDESLAAEIPAEWLTRLAEKLLTDEEKAQVEALGGFDKLMETLKQRLEEQRERHQGGNKWIGTAGTSPFGAYGYNPEGVRNIKRALRRLRKFARQGAPDELDLNGTIQGTAEKGYLDIQLRPERRNTIKVLLFFDIGGSMDGYIKLCEELFSAARAEFKNMEVFYFHNCLYEAVWKDNQRRASEKIATWDVIHKYGHDYKVIFVGDATMSPYEVTQPGGAVEHWNEEAGATWMTRLTDIYESCVWLNPTPERYWEHSASTALLKRLMGERMYPLTLAGLEGAMRELTR